MNIRDITLLIKKQVLMIIRKFIKSHKSLEASSEELMRG